MDINDPEYSIVINMAEMLVPDVCEVIMEYLDAIHIEVGKEKWKTKISELNKEYKKTWLKCDVNTGIYLIYRILTRCNRRYISHFSAAVPIDVRVVGRLPENYMHTRLYA